MGIPYFDIAALPVFIIMITTTVFRKMTRGRSNKLYLMVLFLALFTDIVEISEKVVFNVAPVTKGMIGFITATNYLYFLLRNGVNACYLFFVVSMTRTWYKIRPFWKKIPMLAPYAGIVIALCLNPSTGIIFTISDKAEYVRGDLIIIVYFLALIYMIYGMYYLTKYIHTLDIGSWIALMSLYVLNLLAVIIQFFVPGLLIESFASSITLIFVVLYVQRPEKQVDMSTGLPGYRAFCEEIGKIKATGQDVKVIIVTMKNADDMNRYLGDKLYYDYVYSVEKEIAAYTKKEKINYEFYFEQPGNFYIILEDKDYNPVQAIPELRESVRKKNAAIMGRGASPDLRVVTVTFPEEISDVDELLDFGHNFVRFANVDKKYSRASMIIDQKEYQIEAHLDEILSSAMDKGTLEINYEPIWSVADKEYICGDAVVRINDERFGVIDSDLLIEAAEETGLILKLGDYILDKTFSYATDSNLSQRGYSYITVHLSTPQCMQVGITDQIWSLREKYGVHPEHICFAIKESVYENMSNVFEENLRKLSMQGYRFTLDGYGKGYSNMEHILELPIDSVRLDRSMIEAANTEKGRAVLAGSIGLLKNIPLEVIAQGVDDNETADMLTQMGCEMLQGRFYPEVEK